MIMAGFIQTTQSLCSKLFSLGAIMWVYLSGIVLVVNNVTVDKRSLIA